MIRDTRNEGERRKQERLDLLRDKRAAIVRRGQRALLLWLLDHETGTVDDIRAEVDLPPDTNPTVIGPIPGPLSRARIIERCGDVPTRRVEAHARRISIWRLVDRDAPTKWLAEHPEIPDPLPPKKKIAQRLLPLSDGWEPER